MDFSKITNRFNTNCCKWDCKENDLPMSIADMDFEVAEEILEALNTRMSNKIFGYSYIPDRYYESYVLWWKKRHNFALQPEWLMFSIGVVPSISSIVRRVTHPGENVLIQAPVYNIFYNSIINNGRNVLSSNLIYEDGKYNIDFNDLEAKLKNKQTSLMILCNPHNPVGRIWTKEELQRIGELAYKYNVIVLSDEIHCDITKPGLSYIPFASVNEINKNNSITCIAPTKTFNLAGLQTSCISIPNPNLRHKIYRGINNDEIAEGNAFSIEPVIAAYTKCSYWVDAMREYIWKNREYVMQFIKDEISELKYIEAEATYLAWIDCEKITNDSVEFTEFLRKNVGLILNDGYEYGESGKTFVRMNLACSIERVKEGMNRLKEGTKKYKSK